MARVKGNDFDPFTIQFIEDEIYKRNQREKKERFAKREAKSETDVKKDSSSDTNSRHFIPKE